MTFKVPVDQVTSHLAEMIKAEFVTHYAYKTYAQTFRDLSRDSVAQHFEEHAQDEMEHADFLLRRLSVLNGDAPVPNVDAPAPLSNPESIIQTMIDLEESGIEKWKKLVDMVGDDPTYITAEEYMAKELEHSDELKQLLATSSPPLSQEVKGEVKFMPPSPAFLLSSIAARIVAKQERTEKIVKEDGEWCVKSEKNPDWSGGCYKSKEKAQDRLNQVEMFKHMKKK